MPQRFGQFWSPVLEGDVATIEIHAGAGVQVDGLTLTLPRVAHQVVGSAEMRVDVGEDGQRNRHGAELQHRRCLRQALGGADAMRRRRSRSCCSSATLTATQYLCTGTLLNDLPSTNTPYLFTAAHCMTSANAAHTLNTFWFFDAVACKDNAVPPFVQLTAGAALLGRSQDHDWALVRLNEPPPAGARFAAWNAGPVPIGAATTTLHHPLGDLKKYARGYVGQAVFLVRFRRARHVQRGPLHQRHHRGRFQRIGAADLSRFRRVLRGPGRHLRGQPRHVPGGAGRRRSTTIRGWRTCCRWCANT